MNNDKKPKELAENEISPMMQDFLKTSRGINSQNAATTDAVEDNPEISDMMKNFIDNRKKQQQ